MNYENSTFRHPEDMSKIISYLSEHGEIQVSTKTIERLYEDFSEDSYCAGWMSLDGDFPSVVLVNFAGYLESIEI